MMKYFTLIPTDTEVTREYQVTREFYQYIERLRSVYTTLDKYSKDGNTPSELRSMMISNMNKISALGQTFNDNFGISLFQLKENSRITMTEPMSTNPELIKVIESINQELAANDEKSYLIFTGENPLDLVK